jgi:protein-S-isoprenylcysteine O-methyltransferase Ste14
LLVLAGLAFATRSATLTFLTALTAVAAHAWIVRVEEPRLAARFGEAYSAYLRHVPRWLPSSTRETH